MGAVGCLHDRDGSIRNRGGNVPIVIQRRFSDVIVRDTDVAPTLEAGGAREETISQCFFMKQMTFNQISQSAVYREDDISVSLTVCGGSYGGAVKY